MAGFNFTLPDDPSNPYPGLNPIPQPGAFADFIMGQQGGNPSNQGAGDVQMPQMQAPSGTAAAPPPPPDTPTAPPQTQDVTATPQGALPPQVSTNSSMGQQAVKSGASRAQQSPTAMFTDPTALLAIAATLGQSPNFGESGVGQIARALQMGNQVIMAKNYQGQQETRQAALDAQEAAKNQSGIDYQTAQSAHLAQQTEEGKQTLELKKQGMQSEIDVAKQRISSAKTADERQRAETEYQNLTNKYYKTYGERAEEAKTQELEAKPGATKADTAYKQSETALNIPKAGEINARADLTRAEAAKTQAWIKAVQDMPDEESRARAIFGTRTRLSESEKFQDFLKEHSKAYTKTDMSGNSLGLNTARAERNYGQLFPSSEIGKRVAAMPNQAYVEQGLKERIAAKKITREQATAWLEQKGYDAAQF